MSDRALEITPQDLQYQRLRGQTVTLVDVREPHEFACARIEGAWLVPMQAVPAELQRLTQLADEGPLLVLCHHGVRSLQVVQWLRRQGIENCFSVAGGIDRWSCEIDPTVPRY